MSSFSVRFQRSLCESKHGPGDCNVVCCVQLPWPLWKGPRIWKIEWDQYHWSVILYQHVTSVHQTVNHICSVETSSHVTSKDQQQIKPFSKIIMYSKTTKQIVNKAVTYWALCALQAELICWWWNWLLCYCLYLSPSILRQLFFVFTSDRSNLLLLIFALYPRVLHIFALSTCEFT